MKKTEQKQNKNNNNKTERKRKEKKTQKQKQILHGHLSRPGNEPRPLGLPRVPPRLKGEQLVRENQSPGGMKRREVELGRHRELDNPLLQFVEGLTVDEVMHRLLILQCNNISAQNS